MKRILLDKIASVTRNCHLNRKAQITGEIPCEEGVVIAARVLTDKSSYNKIELTTGRMADAHRGDVIAGVLGHRNALFGYSGHVPESLAAGDHIHVLNLGGVLGICDSQNPDLGAPFTCEVLGALLHFPVLGERIGVPARIGLEPLDLEAPLVTRGIPVIGLVGTCMSAGKTAAACALVQELTRSGHTVDALKATGVSLRRDILAMEDAGARHTALFTDLGVVSTSPKNGPAVTRILTSRLATERPDVIVVELGDGLMGAYGVDAILRDEAIRNAFSAVVLAANDPVAAWGGTKLLRDDYGIEPTAITGPATDNEAGTRIISERVGLPAINARTAAPELAALVARAANLDGKGT